ncbi:MAG: caspase family protein [Anaeromyxobacter sp.]
MIAAPALALAALVAAQAPAGEGARVALLVAADAGLPGERPLRHTGADVERLAAVLQELGGFAPGDVHVLRDRNAAEVLDAIDALGHGPMPSMLLFFYSGHADAAALHPAGTVLPLDLLLHRLKGVSAELRIGVLDACQSGAAARGKGSTPAPPFAVRFEEQGPEGDILISSSADDELSFEGEHGGIFTLHLAAALRGAADANGDGRVSLGEAYEYAYAQTLRSTLGASTGPQHARFRYELTGRRDPVLTQLGRGAQLTLSPVSDGEYVVFDGAERAVVAELPSRAGEPRRIALAPGAYVVQQRSTARLRVARIALEREDDRVLHEHQMQELPLVKLARKGSPGDRRMWLGGGQYGSALGPQSQLLGAAGLEYEGAVWLVGLELGLARGDERHLGLPTADTFSQVSASALATLRVGAASLRAGPTAGVAYLRQETQGRTPRHTLGPAAGLALRADLDVTRTLSLIAMAEGRLVAVRVEGDLDRPAFRALGAAFVPMEAYALGIRFAF